MKNIKPLYLTLLIAFASVLSSCEIDQLVDPNNPSISLVDNATLGEIQNLVSGIESGMRNGLNTYYSNVGVIGREYYRFSGSDPRFTSDLLGKGAAVLDDNTFYLTIPFSSRYRVVKNANLAIEAIQNTSAALSDAQKSNILGLVKTLQAHEYLMVLNMLHTNGIRTDVADPDNLGAFRSLSESLSDIRALLDEAATDLGVGSESSFSVVLSPGFAGFDTPSTFLQFNRALAARVAVYQENWAEALTLLGNSFFDLNGSLTTGTSHFFSTAGGDLTNPVFYPPNATGEFIVAHPNYVTEAEVGDTRIANQVSQRDATATQDDLSSDYDLAIYTSQSSPISIIRNAELILIYAEANIQSNNFADAVTALNIIRNAAGLPDYAGTVDQANLLDEMLNQRRFELFAEGHRWVDMRRYNRLTELPIDRVGDDVWELFPVPVTEEGF